MTRAAAPRPVVTGRRALYLTPEGKEVLTVRPFASYRPAALAALTLVAFLAVAGCSNDDKTETPPQEFAPPTNLAATNGDQSIVSASSLFDTM